MYCNRKTTSRLATNPEKRQKRSSRVKRTVRPYIIQHHINVINFTVYYVRIDTGATLLKLEDVFDQEDDHVKGSNLFSLRILAQYFFLLFPD